MPALVCPHLVCPDCEPATLRPVCEWCGTAMPVPARPQGGGRTKRYCSGRCRTAAHRSRPPAWAPDTLHAALGTDRLGSPRTPSPGPPGKLV